MDLEASKRKVEALTAPRNVVLVGASDRPGSWAARVAQPQPLQVSGADLSHQSAPHRDLGQALLSGFQVAAGTARPPGGAGAGGRRRRDVCAAARRRARAAPPCSRPASAKAFDTKAAALGRELTAVIAETGLAVSGPNCMGNVCAKSRLVTLTEDRPLAAPRPGRAGRPERRHDDLHQRGARGARHRRRISDHQRQRSRPVGSATTSPSSPTRPSSR